MPDNPPGPRVRIRTAQERKKALAQLQELRLQGQVAQALVIVQRRDGDIEVLGQELRPYELLRLVAAAAIAIEQTDGQRTAARLEGLVAAIAQGGVANEGDRIRPKITSAPDGTLVPPPGETLISCPVCRHPRYHVTVGEPGTQMDGLVRRLACAHCGNEVSWGADDYPADAGA
jgi:hypothetical protein